MTSTDCDFFRCPDDETVVSGQGNLSYVVNGGFSRWHAEGHAYGWAGTARGGANGPTLDWGQSVAEKTGVMFLGSSAGNAPWDHKTSLDQITDGTSSTVLLAENRLVGVSSGTPYSDGVATNWACPHPNFCMFIASDDVCTRGASSGVNCSTVGDLEERSGHGAGWALASRAGLPESVNSGRGLSVEGSSPFPNGNHPGLIIVGMCDGSTRSVRDSIDGSVWAKLVTPAGYSLPPKYCQFPPGPSGY